jgi:hypothetical protein
MPIEININSQKYVIYGRPIVTEDNVTHTQLSVVKEGETPPKNSRPIDELPAVAFRYSLDVQVELREPGTYLWPHDAIHYMFTEEQKNRLKELEKAKKKANELAIKAQESKKLRKSHDEGYADAIQDLIDGKRPDELRKIVQSHVNLALVAGYLGSIK